MKKPTKPVGSTGDAAACAIGYATADITPGPHESLVGYAQREELHGKGNAGAHDPLHVRATVIATGTERAALVVLDLCILENDAADELRERIGELINGDPKHIIVATTHTHSAPLARPQQGDTARPGEISALRVETASPRYWQVVCEAVAAAVAEALSDLAPARLRFREAALGFAYTRRVADGQAVTMCWNPRETPALRPDPADDDRLVCLEIQRNGRTPLILFNLAGHPVVLGKQSNCISADWPGAVCRRLASQDIDGCFLHGAGADAHPWLATGTDPRSLDRVAAPVASLIQLLHATGGDSLDDTSFAAAAARFDLHNSAVHLTAWRLGPVRVLAFPGEVFGASGRQLRDRCPGPLLLATTANGYSGYWPPVEAFERGGYEVEMALRAGIRKGDTERLLTKMAGLLKAL